MIKVKAKRGRPKLRLSNDEISRIRGMLDARVSIDSICYRTGRSSRTVIKIRDGFIFEDTKVTLFDGIPSGVLHRCPDCGKKIYIPCRYCRDTKAIAAKRLKV